jgi:hypothetical protein
MIEKPSTPAIQKAVKRRQGNGNGGVGQGRNPGNGGVGGNGQVGRGAGGNGPGYGGGPQCHRLFNIRRHLQWKSV